MTKKRLRNPEFWLLAEEAAAEAWRAEASLAEWATELARFKRDRLRARRRSESKRNEQRNKA